MTSAPLGPLRLGWRNHKLALWYLGLLYRRPRWFTERLKAGSRTQQLKNSLILCLHALPCMIVLSVLGRMAVTGSLPNLSWAMDIAFGFAVGIAGGIAFGIVGGIAAGVAPGIAFGIVGGIAAGIAFGVAPGIGGGIAVGIVGGIAFGVAPGFAVGIVGGIAFGIVGGIAGGIRFGIVGGIAFGVACGIACGIAGRIAGGIAFGIACGIACGISVWRLYYQPLYFWVAWPTPRPSLYRFHPVAWDDLCSFPFLGLDKLLVAYAGWDAEAARKEIQRLITRYPSQRTAALRAQVVLIARESGRVTDLTQLDAVLARLPEGEKRFLREAQQIRAWVGEITRIQTRLNTADRAIFRQPYAQSLVTEIENFEARIGGFDFFLAKEFRAAAENWKQMALRLRKEAEAVTAKEPVHQVFRAGDPIDRSKEAFVPRDAVVGALEQQIMLSTGCPGIILYGRRRVGKSTVLRNLDGFLPPSVIPIVVSMQHPEMLTSSRALFDIWFDG